MCYSPVQMHNYARFSLLTHAHIVDFTAGLEVKLTPSKPTWGLEEDPRVCVPCLRVIRSTAVQLYSRPAPLTARADGTQPPVAGSRYQLSTLFFPSLPPLAGSLATAPKLVVPGERAE